MTGRVTGQLCGIGVGVWPDPGRFHLASIAARMSRTLAPERVICMASLATSRHTAQSSPCGSHSVTSPCALRVFTKQSSLPLWPPRSQPQKQGT